MTDNIVSERASSALKRASNVLDELHAANFEVARALAPLPFQDTLVTTESRGLLEEAGRSVVRAAGLHIELATILGKLEAAASD